MKVECLILILVLMLEGFDGLEEVTDQNTWVNAFLRFGFVDWREVGDNIKDITCINTYMARRQKHQQRAIIDLVIQEGSQLLSCSKNTTEINKYKYGIHTLDNPVRILLTCDCHLLVDGMKESSRDVFNVLTSNPHELHFIMDKTSGSEWWMIEEVWSFANPLQ